MCCVLSASQAHHFMRKCEREHVLHCQLPTITRAQARQTQCCTAAMLLWRAGLYRGYSLTLARDIPSHGQQPLHALELLLLEGLLMLATCGCRPVLCRLPCPVAVGRGQAKAGAASSRPLSGRQAVYACQFLDTVGLQGAVTCLRRRCWAAREQ